MNHLKECTFYTDDWESFKKVLPSKRHVIGKQHTHAIERDNSNTRHYLDRMVRKTKIVSKSEEMINKTLKLWYYLTIPKYFNLHRNKLLSIF